MMPEIAKGDANKVWIVPSEIGKALEGLGSTMNSLRGIPDEVDGPRKRVDMGSSTPDVGEIERENQEALDQAHDEVAAAIAAAEASTQVTGAAPGRDRTQDREQDSGAAAEPSGDPGEPPAQ
jgi:hypothetical protein